MQIYTFSVQDYFNELIIPVCLKPWEGVHDCKDMNSCLLRNDIIKYNPFRNVGKYVQNIVFS